LFPRRWGLSITIIHNVPYLKEDVMKNFIILATIMFMIVIGCSSKINNEAEKTVIQSIVNDVEKAFETNNPELLSKIFSHSPDNIFIGTDAAERWVGYDAFIEAQKRFFTSIETGSQITFRDIVLSINKSGDTAVVSHLMDWKGKAQGEPFNFEGLRETIVLEKQNGKWVIVHVHGSVPVSGQAMKY